MTTEMSNAELAAQLLEFKNWLVSPMEDVSKPKKARSSKPKRTVPEKDENGKFMKKSKSKTTGSESSGSSSDESLPEVQKPKSKGKRTKEPTTHEQDTQDKFVHNRGKKQKQINVDPVVEAGADSQPKQTSKSSTSTDGTSEPKAKARGGPRF
jgi:hypothetical protein